MTLIHHSRPCSREAIKKMLQHDEARMSFGLDYVEFTSFLIKFAVEVRPLRSNFQLF